MNFRQVNLGFHTSEKIPHIGKKFNKKQFQEALKVGHANSNLSKSGLLLTLNLPIKR